MKPMIERAAYLGGTVLRSAPFTVGFLALMWVFALVSGSFMHGPSDLLAARVSVGSGPLAEGAWLSPLTSMLWCGDAAGYVATTVLAIALCIPAERCLGSARTAVLFVLTHVTGVVFASVLVGLGARSGEPWSVYIAESTAVGPSTAVMGVALAWSGWCSPLWRRRLRLILLAGLIMLVLYSGLLLDVLRLCSGLAGLLVGALAARRRSRLARRRTPGSELDCYAGPPSRPEARLLLALVVAVSAIGPALAAVSQTAIGPLSVLQYVFLSPSPDAADVRDVCADPELLTYCRTMQAQIRLRGLASGFLSVIPVLLLLVMAEGLRRGRRFALWGAVIINTALAVCGAVFFELIPAIFNGGIGSITSYLDVEMLVGLITSTLQPLLVVGLLLVNRRAFDVVAPRRTYRGLALTGSVALVAVSVLYVALGYLIRHQFQPVPTFGRILADLPLRFVPAGYLGEATLSFVPTRPFAEVLYEWTGALFWAVVLFATIKTFWRSRLQPKADDLARTRQLLVAYGGSELSYMATWRGNSYWFSPDGRAVVAYRVVGSVALTIGEPIGHPVARPAAVRGFADFCAARGWIPCFYSITAQMAPTLADSGWRLLQVAEETQLPLAQLEFTGRKWQDVRTAINKAGRAGITAEWHHYRHSELWITEQIRHISEEWLHDKGMPEMGFTLGGLHELGDDDVRCLLAVDEERRVHAVTSWMPVYRDGLVIGWTLDFMRRRADACTGVMEFLIASAARQFRQEGAEFISLSGAPLARRNGTDEAPAQGAVLQVLLDLMGGMLEPVYGFRSLLAFKSKFQPVYQPLFMAYPDPAALPAIGGAITRAYLPQMTLYQGLRLVRRILSGLRSGPRRLPVRPVAPGLGVPPGVVVTGAPDPQGDPVCGSPSGRSR